MLDVLATTSNFLNHRTDAYLPCPAHHPILTHNVELLHLRTKTTFAGTTKTMARVHANARRNVHFSLLGILTSHLLYIWAFKLIRRCAKPPLSSKIFTVNSASPNHSSTNVTNHICLFDMQNEINFIVETASPKSLLLAHLYGDHQAEPSNSYDLSGPDPIHDPEKHDSEWTPSRMDTIPNRPNPEWTQSRVDTIPNGHNPEWTQSRMDTIPNGHHPEWTQSRMDTIPNGHNPERTQSRMDTIPNGHHPEWIQSRKNTIPNGHNPE